jgi:hypothetical protein
MTVGTMGIGAESVMSPRIPGRARLTKSPKFEVERRESVFSPPSPDSESTNRSMVACLRALGPKSGL